MSRKIMWDEIAKHNQPQDVWFVVEGKVYNPTAYLDDHPGGPAILQNRAGRDATRDFIETGHTQNARQKMNEYLVGDLDTTSVPLDWQRSSDNQMDLKQLGIVGAALLVVLTVVYLFIMK